MNRWNNSKLDREDAVANATSCSTAVAFATAPKSNSVSACANPMPSEVMANLYIFQDVKKSRMYNCLTHVLTSLDMPVAALRIVMFLFGYFRFLVRGAFEIRNFID